MEDASIAEAVYTSWFVLRLSNNQHSWYSYQFVLIPVEQS
jgi:uncharacterized protein Veg